jgi:SAM-dependent methyltransferase
MLPAGEIELESPRCPVCGGTQYRCVLNGARDRLGRKQGVFELQACTACQLVATRPRPTARQLGYYYEGVYGSAPAQFVQGGAPSRSAARYRLRALQGIATLDARKKLLDVGCGYGSFLAEARRQTGCEATGLDLDADCLGQAADREHIRYLRTSIEAADLPAGSFDVVTLFQSLEHHLDPVAALRAAHRLLKPGGHCIVEVPNFDGAWRPVFRTWWLPLLVPQHLFHFTPRTLRRVLEEASFDVPEQHRAMFYPTESTLSLGLWLNEALGRPLRAYRPRWRRPDGLLLVALLPLWWLLVEVPSQALLVLLGRTGHQLMVGRKPAAVP